MSHFAKVLNGKVINVIVAEADFFDTFIDSTPGQWLKTSYNSQAGEYTNKDAPEKSCFRKNFACIGGTYDMVRDAFIPTKVYKSWVLDEVTCRWVSPEEYPNNTNNYNWDEANETWIQVAD